MYHSESCPYLSYQHRGQGRLAELSPQIIVYPAWVGCCRYTDHNVPSLGRMLHIGSSGMACIIKFNVFHFGLLVSFHIANLRLEISGNKVTPGENCENLHLVKFPMYTCMHVYLKLPSFLLPTHVPSQTHISS